MSNAVLEVTLQSGTKKQYHIQWNGLCERCAFLESSVSFATAQFNHGGDRMAVFVTCGFQQEECVWDAFVSSLHAEQLHVTQLHEALGGSLERIHALEELSDYMIFPFLGNFLMWLRCICSLYPPRLHALVLYELEWRHNMQHTSACAVFREVSRVSDVLSLENSPSEATGLALEWNTPHGHAFAMYRSSMSHLTRWTALPSDMVATFDMSTFFPQKVVLTKCIPKGCVGTVAIIGGVLPEIIRSCVQPFHPFRQRVWNIVLIGTWGKEHVQPFVANLEIMLQSAHALRVLADGDYVSFEVVSPFASGKFVVNLLGFPDIMSALLQVPVACQAIAWYEGRIVGLPSAFHALQTGENVVRPFGLVDVMGARCNTTTLELGRMWMCLWHDIMARELGMRWIAPFCIGSHLPSESPHVTDLYVRQGPLFIQLKHSSASTEPVIDLTLLGSSIKEWVPENLLAKLQYVTEDGPSRLGTSEDLASFACSTGKYGETIDDMRAEYVLDARWTQVNSFAVHGHKRMFRAAGYRRGRNTFVYFTCYNHESDFQLKKPLCVNMFTELKLCPPV